MYWRVIDVRFYASVVDLSAVHVDDMLQMRKKNNKRFCFVLFFGLFFWFVCLLLFCFVFCMLLHMCSIWA